MDNALVQCKHERTELSFASYMLALTLKYWQWDLENTVLFLRGKFRINMPKDSGPNMGCL
jgi:hypothetical protein